MMMTSEQKTIRNLINNERKFLTAPGANVTVVARIKGNINYYALEKAINRLKQKHPLISCKIHETNQIKSFVYDPEIKVQLRSVARTSDKKWIEEIRQESLIPYDLSKGPLIRFILIYSPEASELVVFGQHSICDGTALAFLIHDLLIMLNDPNTSIKLLTPDFNIIDLLGLKNGGVTQKIKSIFVNRINNQWMKRQIIFDYQDYLEIYTAFNRKYEYGVELIEIDEKDTMKLTEKCRSHGVTINSALTASLVQAYRAVYKAGENKKLNVVMPFDLRRRTDPPLDDVFCLLVGSLEVTIPPSSSSSFWENVTKLHENIQSKLQKKDVFESATMIEDLEPTLADVIISFAPLSKEVKPGSQRYAKLAGFASDTKNPAIDIANKFSDSLPEVVNTNLGRLNFPRKIGGYELDTMYFAPAGSINVPIIAGFLGVSGKLTGTLNYLRQKEDAVDVTGEKLRAVRDKMLELLEIGADEN